MSNNKESKRAQQRRQQQRGSGSGGGSDDDDDNGVTGRSQIVWGVVGALGAVAVAVWWVATPALTSRAHTHTGHLSLDDEADQAHQDSVLSALSSCPSLSSVFVTHAAVDAGRHDMVGLVDGNGDHATLKHFVGVERGALDRFEDTGSWDGAFATTDGRFRTPTLEFVREACALSALQASGSAVGPRVRCVAPRSASVVTETVLCSSTLAEALGVRPAGGATLDDVLVAHPVDSLLSKTAEALAELHGPSVVGAVTNGCTGELTNAREQDVELLADTANAFHSLCEQLGVTPHPSLRTDLERVSRALADPGPLLALTHGDVCPDNVLVERDSGGVRVRLVDFSQAGLRSLLLDVAALGMAFPTCWCVGNMPHALVAQMEGAYRSRLLQLLPDNSEAADIIRSDEQFFPALAHASAFHLLNVVSEFTEAALHKEQVGPLQLDARALVTTRINAFLRQADSAGVLGGLVDTAFRLRESLNDRWGRDHALKAFPELLRPAFHSVGASQESVVDEIARLARFATNATDWLLRDSPHAVKSVDASELPAGPSSLLLGQSEPVVVRGAGSGWGKVSEWTIGSVVGALAQSAPAVKLSEGCTPRFPIGSSPSHRNASLLLDPHAWAYLSHRLEPGSPLFAELAEHSGPWSLGEEGAIHNLWCGSEGVITPVHYDPFRNVFLQVQGWKRFLLFPPAQHEAMYLHPRTHVRHRQAQVNLNDPDLSRFPQMSGLRVRVVTVGPGDALYLPPMWFHQVESLTHAVSVSSFFPDDGAQRLVAALEVLPPFALGNGSVEFVSHMLRVWITAVVKHVLGDDKTDAVARMLASRYAPLHTSDGAGLGVLAVDDPHVAQFLQEQSILNSQCLAGDCAPDQPGGGKPYCAGAPPASLTCNLQTETAALARQAAAVLVGGSSPSRGVDRGVVEVLLFDYIEDLAGQVVGDGNVWGALSACFPPVAPTEWECRASISL